jgi:hypothetical protein
VSCGTEERSATDASLTGVAFQDDFESLPVGVTWTEGSVHGNWRDVQNGLGRTTIVQLDSRVLHENTATPSSPTATHTSLTVSTASFGDLDLSLKLRTLAQLRTPSPNPWEVAWVLWHYGDLNHYYYVVLKPNGWELGKRDPAYPGSQRFLATGASPTFSTGPWYNVRVRQVGAAISVWANGMLLTSFTDNERPYLSGSIGLSGQEAHVHFDNVVVLRTAPTTSGGDGGTGTGTGSDGGTGTGSGSDGGTTSPPPSLFSDNFEALPIGMDWADGSAHGAWTDVFNGFGTVGIEQAETHVLGQVPQVSTSAGETHSSLVTTNQSFGDLDLTLRMKTVAQLRTSQPNPWEVAWVFWHYTDNVHFYYLSLKPNGWELGKEDPAYPGAQRFLANASSPSFPVGMWNTVRVRQVGNSMSVYANGQLLTTFVDSERPYLSGSIGLYNEDSHAQFDDVQVQAP